MQNEETKQVPAPVAGQENSAAQPAVNQPADAAPAAEKGQNYLEYSIEKATATTTMVIASIAGLSTFTILYAVFMIYLGIYAYGNPDPANAYYIDGLDTTGVTIESVETLAKDGGITVRPGYPIDMAHLFRTWFLWGFWGCIFQLCVAAAVIPLCFFLKEQVHVLNIVGGVLEAVSCCSSAAWFILGFFWRFSRAGRVASGEKLDRPDGLTDDEWSTLVNNASSADGYQLKSGNFMGVYLGLVVILLLLAVAAGSVLLIINCLQNDKSADIEANAEARTGANANAGDNEARKNEGENSALLATTTAAQ